MRIILPASQNRKPACGDQFCWIARGFAGNRNHAGVAKLVNAAALEAVGQRLVGPSPTTGTLITLARKAIRRELVHGTSTACRPLFGSQLLSAHRLPGGACYSDIQIPTRSGASVSC